MHCPVLFPAGNMMLFDAEGHIKRYDSPEDILREFFDLRLTFYEKRRVGMLQVRLNTGEAASCLQNPTRQQLAHATCARQVAQVPQIDQVQHSMKVCTIAFLLSACCCTGLLP
jgi:hypothetical protein